MGKKTDIDLLPEFGSYDEPIKWTAPRWVQRGDIVFFYHTKSAKQHVTRPCKDVQQHYGLPRDERRVISQLLESAVDQADRYSGTVFGCAEASGSAEYLGDQGGQFRTPFFVPLGRAHIFERPLSYDIFRDIVQISQGPIKRLHKPQFALIKELLASQNELPRFLQDADAAETEFPDVDQASWSDISCSDSVRFIDEARAYAC